MKKLVFLMGVFFAFTLFSCGEKNEKSESFAEIIKDPAKRMELLRIADSINRANPLGKKINNDDKISKGMRDGIRHNNQIKIDSIDSSIIKIAWADMQEVLDTLKGADSLVFYLGSYKDPKSYKSYDRRNHTNYSTKNKELKNLPTFVIGPGKDTTTSIKKVPSNQFYDIGRLCPPPPGGCY